MKNTKALVKFFTSRDFIANYFMKQPGVFELGDLFLKTAKLATPKQVIKKHCRDFPKSMSFYYNGRSYPMFSDFSEEKSRERYQAALEIFEEKAPIILPQFHEGNAFYGEICNGLKDAYKADTQSMIIYSPESAVGAKKHIDRSHIFVFQYEGKCHWKVHGRGKRKLLLDRVLKPGDVLHVPQGFYHEVEILSKFHSHVTVGFRYKTPRVEMRMLYNHPLLFPAIPEYSEKLTQKDIRALIQSYPDRPLLPDN